MRIAVAALCAAAITTAADRGGAAAQEVALGAPTATYVEAFGLIGGMRALSDGSLLVADPLGGVLVRLDPDLSVATRLGREGEGPGEYRQPDAIWPIGGDRSLLVDLGNARLTIVEPDGTLGEDTPIMLPGGEGPDQMRLAIPGGTDGSGHVYFTGSSMGPEGPRDSIELLRVDPWDPAPETVAMLEGPELTVQRSGGANDQSVNVRQVPFGGGDTWGVATDGSLFIARSGDYRVEYHRAAGSVRAGPPMDVRRVGIGTDEKLEWIDESARNGGVGVSVEVENGRRQVSMGRSTGQRAELDSYDWPEAKPPFENARIRIDSGGNGWVRRSLPAGEPPLYDVFDTQGRHVKSVRFPESRTLLGFGDGLLYAARTDEFDQQFLERYDVP